MKLDSARHICDVTGRDAPKDVQSIYTLPCNWLDRVFAVPERTALLLETFFVAKMTPAVVKAAGRSHR